MSSLNSINLHDLFSIGLKIDLGIGQTYDRDCETILSKNIQNIPSDYKNLEELEHLLSNCLLRLLLLSGEKLQLSRSDSIMKLISCINEVGDAVYSPMKDILPIPDGLITDKQQNNTIIVDENTAFKVLNPALASHLKKTLDDGNQKNKNQEKNIQQPPSQNQHQNHQNHQNIPAHLSGVERRKQELIRQRQMRNGKK